MEPKCYQVKVLHYLNPHLMWVEVPSTENAACRFEQVGVFGILPLDTRVDMLKDNIESVKSQDWCRGIVSVMDGVLLKANSVWFNPIEEDDRTSIFDHNIHKYGKFVVLNAEGDLVDLSKVLAKSAFAYYDKETFLHELKTFQLQTRLDDYQADNVIQVLRKCYENYCTEKLEALKAVTSIVQAKQDLMDELNNATPQSHVRILPLTSENISRTLERKQRDFSQCKDSDEVSIGRGHLPRHKSTKLRSPGLQLPDVDRPRVGVVSNDPKLLFRDTKNILLTLAKSYQAQKQASPKVSPNTSNRSEKEDETPVCPSLSVRSPKGTCEQVRDLQQMVKKPQPKTKEPYEQNPSRREANQISFDNSENCNHETASYSGTNNFVQDQAYKKIKGTKKSPMPSTKHNEESGPKRIVAFGPPDVEKSRLVPKIMAGLYETTSNIQYHPTPQIKEKEPDEKPQNNLESLDSELDYPVSNRDNLRSKLHDSFIEKSNETSTRSNNVTQKVKVDLDIHESNLKGLDCPVVNRDNLTSQLHDRSVEESVDFADMANETPTQLVQDKPRNEESIQGLVKVNEFKFKSRFSPSTDVVADYKSELFESASVTNTESTPSVTRSDASNSLAKIIEPQVDYNNASLSKSCSANSSLRVNEATLSTSTPTSNMLKKRLEIFRKCQTANISSSTSDTSQKDVSTSSSDDVKTKHCVKTKHRQEIDSDSDESTLSSIVQKLNLDAKQTETAVVETQPQPVSSGTSHVNPFKNCDASISKFVERMVSPVLMVHTRQGKRILPVYDLYDVNFDSQIHRALKDLSVKHPMMLQTVTWPSILRGYSLFMVSPARSGKTLGYAPAICRLVADFDVEDIPDSSGPIAIVVCATAVSVLQVEQLCRRFLGHEKTVLTAYAGVNEKDLTLSLLNGCHVFVCTPPALVRLLNVTDFGLNLKRLTTFVLDDCERLGEVYANEIKFCLIKIKEMLRNRADKVLRVQFVVASRIWCDFMEHLLGKAPNPMVCISDFQECVLYSKCGMSVDFMTNEKKTEAVMKFLRTNDASKRTVIVCRSDDEVETIAEILKKQNHVLFVGKNSQTVEELYNLSKNWAEYDAPLVGPILVCCDSNLTELNTTNAHHLLHYSLPSLFSTFSRRFSVLIDHYPSIFKEKTEGVKIKILLDETNVEQLPKILNFIKRCTDELPNSLDAICDKIIKEKDAAKAQRLLPICDLVLTLGECPDIWNCNERHTLFKDHDEPKHWVPKTGHITFTILHYHNAVTYSARLISNVVKGQSKKFSQGYSMLSLKMGMFYTKEANKRPHGVPEVGDICAVAIRENFFERCQVVMVLSRYDKTGKPNKILIKLIDEEKWERTRDIFLYHLPEELRKIETHVVQVKLAAIQPKDRDIIFSDLAKRQLTKLTEKADNIYMRAKVILSVSNTILVDDLEACQDLTSMGETVVLFNFKEELSSHALLNPDHVKKVQELCKKGGLKIEVEKETVSPVKPKVKELPKPCWAHLDKNDVHLVYFASADNPDKFFVRLEKFEDCLELVTKDIQKYVSDAKSVAVSEANKGDIVLAKFPDDSKYYRARIDKVVDVTKAQCFFVDHGDWRFVEIKDLREMTAEFITKLPFQAIECRLVGIKPVGNTWSEYSTNWLCDQCFEGRSNDLKELYVKYFTKEIAECTGGYKYGIALIDTTTEVDIVINNSMIDYNLASENEEEKEFLDELDFKRKEVVKSDSENEDWIEAIAEKSATLDTSNSLEIVQAKPPSLDQVFLKKPIRSVPLVSSSSDLSDEWDIQFTSEQLKPIFKTPTSNCMPQEGKVSATEVNLPAIMPSSEKTSKKQVEKDASICSSKLSDYEVIASPRNMIEELDSDDYSSSELTQEIEPKELDIIASVPKSDVLRKPKIHWRQTKDHVSIKILLIGVEDYEMDVQARSLTFSTNLLDTQYGFQLDLFGVILPEQSAHSSKGQYVYVKLKKLLKKSWETLVLDAAVPKWIVYDPDDINASSDEEDREIDDKKDTLRKIIELNDDSDEDEEDCDALLDDLSFRHRYHRDSE